MILARVLSLAATCVVVVVVAGCSSPQPAQTVLSVRVRSVGSEFLVPSPQDLKQASEGVAVGGSCRSWDLLTSYGASDWELRILVDRANVGRAEQALMLNPKYESLSTLPASDLDTPPTPDRGSPLEPMSCR